MSDVEDIKITPMMRQYLQVKDDLPKDCILLFRMGDFYEMFFEDAERGSELMDITLTRRAGIPMAGVPYHALKNYLPKVIEAGVKVAIAEQMEDPKEAKGIVRREVTQIITPGTILEMDLLKSNKSNYIVAIFQKQEKLGLAAVEISTGEFKITEFSLLSELEIELASLNPAEILYTGSQIEDFGNIKATLNNVTWTKCEGWSFDFENSQENLCKQFKVKTLDGFGCRDLTVAISAAGAVLYYIKNNLRCSAEHINQFWVYNNSAFMVLDRISQRNLELVSPIFTDSKNSSLLAILDKCSTPMGKRLLRDSILRPLQNCAAINYRLDAVEVLFNDQILLVELREILSNVKDLERLIARLSVGSANARDLVALHRSLSVVPILKQCLEIVDNGLLHDLNKKLDSLEDLTDLIDAAILDEVPLTIKDGGIIKTGFNKLLDEFRSASTEGKSWVAAIQAKEQEITNIKSLKVKFNNVFGYFLEVTNNNKDLVPTHWIRKQTLVNAERYITPELKEVEDKILGAEDKSKALEYEIFQEIRQKAVDSTVKIQNIARAIANLDVLVSLSKIAIDENFVRPEINNDFIIEITDGRHPVVERFLENDQFVPNDTILDNEENIMAIITGPNMAGKSTYIRQVAIITIMAQMGSFVPAKKAKIGVVDRIFTRIGAADDLSRGQSTFMVEMVETSNILNNATDRSLIILDEIGRGTSTFDGLSLAWAIAEFILEEVNCRSLFATHYHELTELKMICKGVQNYNVAVKEYHDDIVFLRKIIAGAADKSYGIQVARLAGLPISVVDRAKEILVNLEKKELDNTGEPKIAYQLTPKNKMPKQARRKANFYDNSPTLFDL